MKTTLVKLVSGYVDDLAGSRKARTALLTWAAYALAAKLGADPEMLKELLATGLALVTAHTVTDASASFGKRLAGKPSDSEK